MQTMHESPRRRAAAISSILPFLAIGPASACLECGQSMDAWRVIADTCIAASVLTAMVTCAFDIWLHKRRAGHVPSGTVLHVFLLCAGVSVAPVVATGALDWKHWWWHGLGMAAICALVWVAVRVAVYGYFLRRRGHRRAWYWIALLAGGPPAMAIGLTCLATFLWHGRLPGAC